MDPKNTLRKLLECWKPSIGKVTQIIITEKNYNGNCLVFTIDVNIGEKITSLTSAFYEEVLYMPGTQEAIYFSLENSLHK